MKKVLGLGNALVDILIKMENDSLLEELALPKGSMQLIDADQKEKIQNRVKDMPTSMVSGGSAANTIHGLAKLGAKCGYMGSIHSDSLGDFFTDDLKNAGIEGIFKSGEQATGCANTFVSPDSERTFGTYLGAAIEMTADDLNADQFKGYDYFHIEGYLVQNYPLVEKALQLAKEAGLKVSLDLASYNVVEDNLEFLKKVIPSYVDIIFANEEEAKAFTGKEPEEALEEIAALCDIAVVKVGKDGSFIKHGSLKESVGVIEVKAIDTTGAGDQYAAGFLFGLAKGLPLKACGEIGALLAGKVIEDFGARIPDSQWDFIQGRVAEIMV